MKTPLALLTLSLSLCLAFSGCTKDASADDGCNNCIDAAAVTSTKLDEALLKPGFSVAEFTPISEILADKEKFEGKRLKVKGEVVSLCKSRGCFVNLKSEKDNSQKLRVKVEEGVIVFPAELQGHEVTAEGVFVKVVYPVEKVREIRKANAEREGKEFDPASVTEPIVQWQIHGICAECPDTKWKS